MKKLELGDRMSRLLAAITVVSGTLFLFNVVFKCMNKFCNKVYLNTRMPLGAEHFIAPLFLTSAFIMLLLLIKYCYHEYFNFVYFDEKANNIDFNKKADSAYKNLLGATECIFPTTFLSALLVAFIFEQMPIAIKITICVALTAFIVSSVRKFSKRIKMFELKGYILLGLVIWFIVFMLFMIITITKIGSNLPFAADIKFIDKPLPQMSIKFFNKVPENINIEFYDSKSNVIKSINISDADLNRSFVEVSEKESAPENIKATKKAFIDESNYTYSKLINLNDCLKQGKNYFVMTFQINSTVGSKKYYKIVNTIDYNNGNIQYERDAFSLGKSQ